LDFFKLDEIKVISSTKQEITNYLKNLIQNGTTQEMMVTFNLDFYRISSENSDFYELCKNCDLVVPDGIGIVNLIKRKYGVKIARITGNDVFNIILDLSNQIKIKAAFIGSTPNVIKSLKNKIANEYPNLVITAAISPSQFFEKNESINKEVIREAAESKPDVLFVALGCPRQEFWIRENMVYIGAKLNVGVGGVFDFYTGYKKRSPAIFQYLSMEWLWRLSQEPRRLTNRYIFKDIPFYFQKCFSYIFKDAKK